MSVSAITKAWLLDGKPAAVGRPDVPVGYSVLGFAIYSRSHVRAVTDLLLRRG